MGYGWLIFPLAKDSVMIDSTGQFSVDLSLPGHDVFYISNGDFNGKVFYMKGISNSDTLHRVIIPDLDFYSTYRKIKKCPICLKSQNIVPVAYGLPSKKMFRQAKSQRLMLMGCILPEHPFEYYCKEDGFYF